MKRAFLSSSTRRHLVKLIGGAGALPTLWLTSVNAQASAMPVVGFLHTQSLNQSGDRLRAFSSGLEETGYIEGRSVLIESRWAEGRYERLGALAADLVSRQVAVIAATGGTEAASAAKKATSTIPIVFTAGSDPVEAGLVDSLNRPGGNVTGVTPFTRQLGAKQLGLLQATVPAANLVAVFMHRKNLDSEAQTEDIETAAQSLGLKILPLPISGERDLHAAIATAVNRGAGALLVGGGAFYTAQRVQLIVLTARHAVPALYSSREFPIAGGLMSYGSSLPDMYRQAGIYVGRVLKGEKPGDMPVMQPTKFELVINLNTARAIGLDVPLHVQQLADEIIE